MAGVIQGSFPHGLPRIAQPQTVQPFAGHATPAWVQARIGSHAPQPQTVQRHAAPAHPNALQIPGHVAPLATHGGQPLPPQVRQKMEAAFGARFDDVRIHIGQQAQALGATAITQGAHIHFAPGQYDPHTHHGQQLLGRELAHVVQQRAGRVRNPFGNGTAIVQDRTLEAEAERMAMRAATLRPVQPVQRKVAGRHVVQRLFDRTLGLPLSTMRLDAADIEVAKVGNFYQLDPVVATECYIYESQVTDNHDGTITLRDDIKGLLRTFLAGTLDLYRGVPHWHETFYKVCRGRMASLGLGQLPDTSTINTKFIPFSPDAVTARNFAKTRAPGFGSHRSMEYVFGYDPTNPRFVLGVCAHMAVGRHDAIGIINASEIQIAGPLTNADYDLEVYRAGTRASALHSGLPSHQRAIDTYGTQTLGEAAPDRPTNRELTAFRATHGGLVHEVLIVPPTAVWIADNLGNTCHNCNTAFSFFTRRHHCRVCGRIFCDACTGLRRRVQNPLTEAGHAAGISEVRVCNHCYNNADTL